MDAVCPVFIKKTAQLFAGGLTFGEGGMVAQLRQHGLRLGLVDVDADLAIAPAHGIGAGVLTEHQFMAAAQFTGIKALIVGGITQQATDMDA